MTVPPDQPAGGTGPGQPDDAPLDFDPYRFGKPDHPIPPEYAPPGYVPPAPGDPGPVWPPKNTPPPHQVQQPPQYQTPYQQPYGQQPYGQHPYGPGQYQPHPPPPPGYPAYGMVQQSNGKATTAMVLGILGIVFFWLTVLDLGLAVPAIVLGALALRDAKRFPERGGRGKALAGLICGIVSVALVLVTVVVVYARVKPCLKYGLSSDAYNSCVNERI
jgi:hypothetical protein